MRNEIDPFEIADFRRKQKLEDFDEQDLDLMADEMNSESEYEEEEEYGVAV